MRITNLHLAGSTYCEGQELIHREMKKGHTLLVENLYLVRDSYNPVDANAVQVWYDDNGEKVRLGYVQRDQASEVAECMDDGGEVCPTSLALYGASDSNYGLYFSVQMFYPSDIDAPDFDGSDPYKDDYMEPPEYDLDIPDDCDWEIEYPVYNIPVVKREPITCPTRSKDKLSRLLPF